MINRELERFNKWENGKRQKLGNELFLQKYIKEFKRRDIFVKFVLIIVTIISFIIALWHIIQLFRTLSYAFFIYTSITSALFFGWIFATELYFIYASYNIYGIHIERWKKEKEELNKEQINN